MLFISLLVLAVSLFTYNAFAAIGPVTDLHIVNGDVSPDGRLRS